MFETWVDVKGYEGKYKVSDLGRVYSLNNKKMMIPFDDGIGNMIVELYGGNIEYPSYTTKDKAKRIKIHRLVAQHFIENADNYRFVLHKDGNKKNNEIKNLYWSNCSRGLIE